MVFPAGRDAAGQAASPGHPLVGSPGTVSPPPLTCQLPLLGAHFAGRQDHGHAAEITVGDAHEEGEDAGPGRVAEGGLPVGVDAHDEEGDEDHAEAGVDQEVGAPPVVGQGGQDLQPGGQRSSWGVGARSFGEGQEEARGWEAAGAQPRPPSRRVGAHGGGEAPRVALKENTKIKGEGAGVAVLPTPTLPTKSERLKMAMMRMGSHSPSVQLWISDSSPGKRQRVMK